MTGPVLGGIGLGLVWGWLLVMVAWPARADAERTVVALGSASLVLGAGIYALAGVPAVLALGAAAALAAFIGWGVRVEIRRGLQGES